MTKIEERELIKNVITDEVIKNMSVFILNSLKRSGVGVEEVTIKKTASRNGDMLLGVSTNNIPMTPCIFKTLTIEGSSTPFIDDWSNNKIICINFNFNYYWKTFNGGSNGTEFGNMKFYIVIRDGYEMLKINEDLQFSRQCDLID